MIPISTAAFFDRSQRTLGDLRARAETLQAQASGGNRVTRSSDDPVAAARLRSLASADAAQVVDTANADRAQSDLSLADSTLGAFANLVARARELAVQGANGTLSTGQRASLGVELTQIHDSMFALANSRDGNGFALFGGESAGAAYVRDAAGNAVYAGTAASASIDLGDGGSLSRGLTGPEFLTIGSGAGATSILALVKQLGEALQGAVADPLAAANGALDALDASTNAIARAQTVVGTRLAWIDQTVERQQFRSQARDSEQASIGAVDLATSVAGLQQTMLVLQASQASFARLASLSLFDVLR